MIQPLLEAGWMNAILPEIVLVVGGLLLLMIEAFSARTSRAIAGPLAVMILIAATWAQNFTVGGTGTYGYQVAPQQTNCDVSVTQGAHTGVMMVLIGDGSVRGVRESIAFSTSWEIANNPKIQRPLGSEW